MERRAPGLVICEGDTVRLGSLWVDANAFEEASVRGDAVQMHELYGGPFLDLVLEGLPSTMEDWIAFQRERLRELWRRALYERASDSDPQEALVYLLELLTEDPLDEKACYAAMRTYLHLGEPKRALDLYRQHANLLERELGIPPSAEMRTLAERARGGHPRPARSRAMRFVGRIAELEAMGKALAEGRAVLVSGEPGIGKTSLLHTFARQQGLRLLLIQGRPGDAAVPYASLTRMLKQLLAQGAKPETWAQRELALLLPELGEPPRTQNANRLFSAVAHAFRAFPERNWLWGVDDLQFVDRASFLALAALADLLPHTRVLIAFRTGTLSGAKLAWVNRWLTAGATELALGPLGAVEVAAMLGVSQKRAAYLARYTGGNPFYLTLVSRSKGEGKFAADPHAVVRSRVDELGARARKLLELASVAGASFDLPIAAEVLGLPLVEVAESADALERAGLFRRGAPAHDLVTEAALQALSGAARARQHLALARAMERLGGYAPAEVAHHYREGGEPAAAARLLMKAAERAEKSLAYRDALEQYREAIELAPPEERLAYELRSLEPRYRMLLALQEWDELERLLQRAEHLAAMTEDEDLAVMGRLGRAGYHFARLEMAHALQLLDALLAEKISLRPEHRATALYLRAASLQMQREHADSLKAAMEAVRLHPDPGWEFRGWAHNTAAICLMVLGHLDAATKQNRLALQHFTTWGQLEGQANAFRVFAEISARRGANDRARKQFEQALRLARKSGSKRELAYVLASAVRFFQSTGDSMQAARLAREGFELGGPLKGFFEEHLS